MPGVKAETAVIAFDLDGVAVSSGSACSSGKVQPSHVLAAMGVPRGLARGAIRVSIGPATTEADIDRFLNAWKKLAKSLSKGRNRASPPERSLGARRAGAKRTHHNRHIQPAVLETAEEEINAGRTRDRRSGPPIDVDQYKYGFETLIESDKAPKGL